jgi:hypothetical protein
MSISRNYVPQAQKNIHDRLIVVRDHGAWAKGIRESAAASSSGLKPKGPALLL